MLQELAFESWSSRPSVDATVLAELPAVNFAYMLLSLTSVLTQNAGGGATVWQNLRILDGKNNIVAGWALDGGQMTGAANAQIVTTWSTAGLSTITAVQSDGGLYMQSGQLPRDLWILPQWRIQLHYQGVTAGGYSGGDVWEYVIQSIARRP